MTEAAVKDSLRVSHAVVEDQSKNAASESPRGAEQSRTDPMDASLVDWDMETRLKQFVLDILKPNLEMVGSLEKQVDQIYESLGFQKDVKKELAQLRQLCQNNADEMALTRDNVDRLDTVTRECIGTFKKLNTEVTGEVSMQKQNLESKGAVMQEMDRKIEKTSLQLSQLADRVRHFWDHIDERAQSTQESLSDYAGQMEAKLMRLAENHGVLADGCEIADVKMAEFNALLGSLQMDFEELREQIRRGGGESDPNTKRIIKLEEAQQASEAKRQQELLDLCSKVKISEQQAKAHTKVASEIITRRNNEFSTEMRETHEREMTRVREVLQQVDNFMLGTSQLLDDVGDTAKTTSERLEAMVAALRLEVDETVKLRHMDKSSTDVQIKIIENDVKKINHNAKIFQQDLNQINSIAKMLLAAEGMQSTLDLHDAYDRQTITLIGTKDADIKTEDNGLAGGGDTRGRGGANAQRHLLPHPAGGSGRITQVELPATSLQKMAHATPWNTRKGLEVPVSSVTLDPRCLTCSEHSRTLVTAFTLACLNYKSSDIDYQGQTLTRPEMLYVRQSLLYDIAKMMAKLSCDEVMLKNHKGLLQEYGLLDDLRKPALPEREELKHVNDINIEVGKGKIHTVTPPNPNFRPEANSPLKTDRRKGNLPLTRAQGIDRL